MYVVVFEGYMPLLYACNMPFHMSKTHAQNRQHHFEEIKYFLQRLLSFRKMKVRLHFFKGCIAFFHILHFFLQECSFLSKGRPPLQGIFFKKLSLSLKMVVQENEMKAELHKRMYFIFPHLYWFLQE